MVQPDQKESYNVNTPSPFVPCCHGPEYRYVLVKRNGTLHPRERRQNPLDKQTQSKTCLACPNVHYNCIQVTFQPGCILWCRTIYLPEQYPFLFQYMFGSFRNGHVHSNTKWTCQLLTYQPFWPMKNLLLRYRSDNAMVYRHKEGTSDRPYLQYNMPLLSNEAWKVRKKI